MSILRAVPARRHGWSVVTHSGLNKRPAVVKRARIIHQRMWADEFNGGLATLGLGEISAARVIGYSPRMTRRYAAGD